MKRILPLVSLILLLNIVKLNAQSMADSVFFETPTTKIKIDTTGGNLWQIGKPQKAFFSVAHTGQKAILTDTAGYYPPNDTSTFIYTIQGVYNQTCMTCMEFWQKYDMDTLGDKGIIEASYDGGSSWLVVKDTFGNSDNMGMYMFHWESDYHPDNLNYTQHKLIASGNSGGWINSKFCWQWFLALKKDTIIVMPDSLMIRFTFISDSITKNKEGWMIDDIMTIRMDLAGCSGVEENNAETDISVYPNPFTSNLTFEFPETLPEVNLSLYDVYSRLLSTTNASNINKIILQDTDLPKGIYFYRITSKSNIISTGKVIKN